MAKLGWMAMATAMLVMGCGNNNASRSDMGMDAGVSDLSAADLSPEPAVNTGTSLVPTKGLLALGITGDNTILFLDGNALKAIPLAGGTVTTIEPNLGTDIDGFPAFRIRGNVVFSWSGVDATSNTGAMSVWTVAKGLQALTNGSRVSSVSATTDNAQIIFTDNVNAAGTTADLYVSKIDGTGRQLVVANKSIDPACPPVIALANGKFIAAYCDDAGDAGVSSATISVVDPVTGTPTVLFTNTTDFFSLDSSGTNVFAIDANNMGMVRTVGASTTTVIDTNVSDGFITLDGSAVVYATLDGALKRSTIATPTPTTLIGTNVSFIDGVAGDQSYLVFSSQFDQNSGLYDMFVAKTTAAGTPVTLDDMPTGSLFGDPFTADDKYVVYYTDVDTTDFAGTLNFLPIKTVGQPAQIATRVWLSYAAGGSKFIFNDGYVSTTTGGTATLKVIDLSTTAPATIIATKAEQDIFVATDNTHVVYVDDSVKGKEGLYVAPLQ